MLLRFVKFSFGEAYCIEICQSLQRTVIFVLLLHMVVVILIKNQTCEVMLLYLIAVI
jgi:hypothetical protein